MRWKYYVLLFLFVVEVGGNVANAQKKELDESAYQQWRKVDTYQLSADGKWVLYDYTFFDNVEANILNDSVYFLYDVATERTDTLIGIAEPRFWAGGEWLAYWSGKKFVVIRLKDKKCVKWEQEPVLDDKLPLAIHHDDKMCVVENVVDGQKRKLKGLLYYALYGIEGDGMFLYQRDGFRELCLGNINKGKFHQVYRDSTCTLEHFYFSALDRAGYFFIKANEGFEMCIFSSEGEIIKVLSCSQLNKLRLDKYSVDLICGGKLFVYRQAENRDLGTGKEQKEKVCVETWKWNAEYNPQETATRETLFPCRFVYDNKRDTNYIICEEGHGVLYFSRGTESVFAYEKDESPYKLSREWQHDSRFDLYLVDLTNGVHYLVAKELTREVKWSPKGDYLLYFDNRQLTWILVNPITREKRILNKEISFPLYEEDYDRPNPAPPYGIAGWSEDGNDLFVYDRFDIWKIELNGNQRVSCWTGGWGRKHNTNLRFLDENEEVFIKQGKAYLVTTCNEDTRNTGVGRLAANGRLTVLVEGAFSLQVLQKGTDTFLCYRQNYNDDRDLWICDDSFNDWRKITDANPQQRNYKWGDVRQFIWTDYNGQQQKGLLYLPDDYDSARRYPMIVSFYETHTPEMHVYPIPDFSAAMIDIPTYVSKGYVIFAPDVKIEIGKPVESACNTVISGTEALIAEGIAKSDRIGLQGHSWSGYLVASIVARTNIFRCVNVGAATVNLPAVYTSLRGDGSSNMLMYEDWQCRMGKTLWEDVAGYIENSPLFVADRIQTPMLIFHNDHDQAVDYREGLALFLAMRRLGKPVWLLNYPGEGHFLYSREAQRDWTKRMEQFFNYYLKDSLKPSWM